MVKVTGVLFTRLPPGYDWNESIRRQNWNFSIAILAHISRTNVSIFTSRLNWNRKDLLEFWIWLIKLFFF